MNLDGHLGHLSRLQQDAFEQFKQNLVQAQLYTSEPASHSDVTLLRFLRARRFDPVKAQKQFSDTERWRKEKGLDRLYETFDESEFEDARRFYPRWTGRRDKGGHPVYVYRLASLGPIQKELNQVPEQRRYQRICALYELVTRIMLPLCSHLSHPSEPTPISSVTTLIDLDQVSLRTMWNLRSHLQTASTLATAHYPETLHETIVVNSPSFFPTVWGWISGWFDEGTRAKIHVVGRDPAELTRLIAPEHLPKVYGGELDWSFEDEPALDQETQALIGSWRRGPHVFAQGQLYKANEAPSVPR